MIVIIASVRAAWKIIGGLFICVFLQACAGTPQSDALLKTKSNPYLKPVELSQVAFFPQEAYQCGPAALATILTEQGIDVRPQQLTDKIYIPQREGSLQIEIIRTVREFNLVPYIIKPDLGSLLAQVKAGRPVLVLQNLGVSWYPKWHYAVVIGYNLEDESLILRTGVIKRYAVDMHTFEYTWARAKYWGLLALRPDELPVNADSWEYLKAIVAFEQMQNWPVLNQAYQTALHKWPNNRDLLMGYGTALYLQKQLSDAAHYYEMVLAESDYAPAHNNLAQVFAEQGKFTQARQHAEKAISIGGVHVQQYEATLKEIDELQSKANQN